MADTAISIPLDIVTEAPSIKLADQLVDELADLLRESAGLPRPTRMSVDVSASRIFMNFTEDTSGIDALTQWADTFGTTVEIDPVKEGHETAYRVIFDYLGVEIFAYIHIPVPAGTATT